MTAVRRAARTFRGAAVFALLSACARPTAPGGTLMVLASPPNLVMTNQTATPIYSFIVDQRTLALVDWAPCLDPATCDPLAAGTTKTVPYDSILGYSAQTESVVVYWWHLVPNRGTGFRPDSLRAQVVGLR